MADVYVELRKQIKRNIKVKVRVKIENYPNVFLFQYKGITFHL